MTKDPYRYFRVEAHELVDHLARGLLALDGRTGGDAAERVRELLRHAHTMKGAARVVKLAALGDLAHAIEDVLEPLRDGTVAPTPATIDRALALLDAIRAGLATIGETPPPSAPEVRAAAPVAATEPVRPSAPARDDEATLASVRVDIGELDELVEALAAAVAGVGTLARALHAESADRDVGEMRDRLAAVGDRLARARELATDLRLVPADVLATELERAARDAARTLDKTVVVVGEGLDLRIDAAVLASLRGALRHVVRNAVAHGIEPAAERLRRGKPAHGSVTIRFAREGHRVLVTCRDDGRGLDLAALASAAVARGLVAADEAATLDERALVQLVLRGGVSTAGRVDDVAGRGVGLDVVRATVVALRGEIEITSTRGVGTTVALRVPLSLAALPALVVEADGQVALIPLDHVQRTLALGPGGGQGVTRGPDGDRVVVDDVSVPLVGLSRLLDPLGTGRGDQVREPRAAAIVRADGRLAALAVDRIGAIETVVVKRLPPRMAVDPIIAAASIDDAGVPRVVLSPRDVVARAHALRAPERSAPRDRPPVLVVDDSLTTRMLEQSILEAAGFAVEVAESAEEALVKVRERRYGVLVVDVEMPGMSGFELLEALARDPTLRAPPAILVTSRNAPEDLERGRAAGARAYIVKGDFDQRRLVQAIQELMP